MSRYIDANLVKPAMESSDDSLLNQPMTVRHVESLLDELPTVKAIPLDRIKDARGEVNKIGGDIETIADCLQVLDKLIAEAEG